ncbi:GntR family transcriptional regulator [Oceanobacillus alkalisoli]|uniref:GntR family transcriptional regulator n=1 Tax=Oceanobacillus alkalisoli TaxID=2925113 RepID=UPI001EE46D24|nr:GntR family transcriptional regulator [Oceanobacillus alkalisoli]MCG5104984.1 GntR family transcriptional regulator [Oceanobacillus alkalisoli]
MFLKLDMAGDKPIYIQLKEQVIEGIARGSLRPGDDLPSVRALAADIGINLHTVNKVYQQLRQEGYIQIHRSRGVMIHPDGFIKADKTYRTNLKATLRPLIAEAIVHDLSAEEFTRLSQEVYEQILTKEGGDNE